MSDQFFAGLFSAWGFFATQRVNEYQSFSLGINASMKHLSLLREVHNHLGYGNLTTQKRKQKDGMIIETCSWRTGKALDILHFEKTIAPLLLGDKGVSFREWITKFKAYKKILL